MEFLKFKTSFSIPIQVMRSRVNYTEVKQASGTQYILLALINNNSKNDEKLYDVLRKFGVPNDLIFMFIDEIENMIQLDIIKLGRLKFNADYFKEYLVKDFEFTEKGNKIFKNGAVPTGKELVKIVPLYYDLLNNKILTSVGLKMKPNDNENKISEEMFKDYKYDFSSLLDIVQENKKNFNFKEQEEIISVQNEEMKMQSAKYEDCVILKLEDDKLTLTFTDERLENFVKKYYTSENITAIFAYKEKFKFANDMKIVKVKDLSDISNLTSIFLPSQIQTAPQEAPELLIQTGKYYVFKRKYKIGLTLKKEDYGADYLTLNNGVMKAYIPACVDFYVESIDKTISLNLILEKELNSNEKEYFYKEVYNEISSDFTDRNILVAKLISSDDNNYLSQYLTKHILEKNELSQQILNLNVLSKVLTESDNVVQLIAEQILEKTIKEINVSNFATYIDFIKPIQKILGLSSHEFLMKVTQNIDKDEKLFKSILNGNYKMIEALSVINLYDKYLDNIINDEKINADNELALEFEKTRNRLEHLKQLLGIKSTTDYVIDGSYNMIDLINNYVEFEKSYNYLVKYKEFSIDKFSEIENYNSIIKPIYEYAIIEQQSSYKPEKITFDFIENKIKRGDFKSAVADMVIKVDYDLTKELSLNNSNEMDFYDKIVLAENNKLIKPNEASLLHTLRICRNKLLHPSKGEIHFNIDELNKWNEYIFKSEVKDEPPSKN